MFLDDVDQYDDRQSYARQHGGQQHEGSHYPDPETAHLIHQQSLFLLALCIVRLPLAGLWPIFIGAVFPTAFIFSRGLCWVVRMSEAKAAALTAAAGLSTKVEARAARETPGPSRETTAAGRTEAASSETTTTAATHHVEQDLGVDLGTHAAHASHATATEHVRGVHEIIAVVVCSPFPVRLLAPSFHFIMDAM